MARLALAVEDGQWLAGQPFVLGLDDRTSQALFKSRRESILFYRLVPKTLLMFVGVGRVERFVQPETGPLLWHFDGVRRFERPVVSSEELAAPGVRRVLALSPERFGEIVGAGAGADLLTGDLSEAQSPAPAVETYVAVHDEVLRRWRYRCAITGRQFEPASRPHPNLYTAEIRPRGLRGPLHVQNYLPMIRLAREAWRSGVISAGPDHEIVAVLDRLDPELLEAMRPEGRLLLPDDPAFWPAPEHLAFHRVNVFASSLNRPSG